MKSERRRYKNYVGRRHPFSNRSSSSHYNTEKVGANDQGPNVTYDTYYRSLFIGKDSANVIYDADTASLWGGLGETIDGGLGADTI